MEALRDLMRRRDVCVNNEVLHAFSTIESVGTILGFPFWEGAVKTKFNCVYAWAGSNSGPELLDRCMVWNAQTDKRIVFWRGQCLDWPDKLETAPRVKKEIVRSDFEFYYRTFSLVKNLYLSSKWILRIWKSGMDNVGIHVFHVLSPFHLTILVIFKRIDVKTVTSTTVMSDQWQRNIKKLKNKVTGK